MDRPSGLSSDCTPKPSSSEEEIRFMVEYTWQTLLALYERLHISENLRLRNVDSDIVVSGVPAEALKTVAILGELSDAVNEVLRRLQVVTVEEVDVEQGAIRGRVLTGLSAKYWPVALPVVATKVSLETPANLLLVVTLLEVKKRVTGLLERIPKEVSPEIDPLRRVVVERLEGLVQRCDRLLSEPTLKPLTIKAVRFVDDERRVAKLEEQVREDSLRRPREYRAYDKFLRLRRELHENLRVIEEDVKTISELLPTLKISREKLYELFGFTLVLECIFSIFGGVHDVKVDSSGRVLSIYRNGERIDISYNALPQSVESRLKTARYYGILDGEIKVDGLGGLPDTIAVRRRDDKRKLVVIDYKYTRDLSYLVQSRFKVYSYLNEFNADAAILVAPTPTNGLYSDEEAYEQRGFYLTAREYSGSIIKIDDNGKMLALVYVDPQEGCLERSKSALRKVLEISLLL
ncbi:hypothetical protein [Infirmifilum sp. SLHALR2]|nr:MAG: hypothetical protein B7L53_09830 [Thermofilum sp. NZ13]